VIDGFAGTLIVAVEVTLVFATDVAVIVTVSAVVTVAGAVYVTAVVEDPDSAPHPEPVHPAPDRLHVTPALFESFATVAVNIAASPGSTLLLAGPLIVIAVGLDPPPQSHHTEQERNAEHHQKSCKGANYATPSADHYLYLSGETSKLSCGHWVA
jgi:hypothetical protein